MKKNLLITAIAVFFPVLMFAGWVQTDSYGDKTMLSDGKVKFTIDDNGSFMVVDFNDGGLLMVNPGKKIYTDISIDEYCAFMTQMMQAYDDEDMEEEEGEARIVNEGREEIAGIMSNHYKIYVDGELSEELWITDESSIMKEAGKPGFRRKFTDCGPSDDDPASKLEEYKRMMTNGWELKSVSYWDGRPDVDHLTVKMEETDIPASEFKAPSGFNKVDFQTYVMQQE